MRTCILIVLMSMAWFVQSAEHEVLVYENRFSPEVLVVSAGDTITWHVISGRHRLSGVDTQQALIIDSPVLTEGSSYSLEVAVSEPLEVLYESAAHTGMRAAVVVELPKTLFTIDQRINTHYFDTDTPGQGLLLEYVPTSNQVVAYWFTFDSQQQQRWMLGTGSPAGNQVTFQMSATSGGQFVNNQAFTAEPWGELTLIFDDCQNGQAFYNAREEQLSGSFNLQRAYLAELCHD